jgi:hypothetical protein
MRRRGNRTINAQKNDSPSPHHLGEMDAYGAHQWKAGEKNFPPIKIITPKAFSNSLVEIPIK